MYLGAGGTQPPALTRVAVEAGLEPNQRIVLAPPPSLRDGDRIRIRKD